MIQMRTAHACTGITDETTCTTDAGGNSCSWTIAVIEKIRLYVSLIDTRNFNYQLYSLHNIVLKFINESLWVISSLDKC